MIGLGLGVNNPVGIGVYGTCVCVAVVKMYLSVVDIAIHNLLGVVVGSGLVSTSPACTKKTVNRVPIAGVNTIYIADCHTAATAPLHVGCVVSSLSPLLLIGYNQKGGVYIPLRIIASFSASRFVL